MIELTPGLLNQLLHSACVAVGNGKPTSVTGEELLALVSAARQLTAKDAQPRVERDIWSPTGWCKVDALGRPMAIAEPPTDANVIQLDIAQRRVDATLERPESAEQARDIATVAMREDGTRALGVGLYSAGDGKAWLLTPDQADELALSLVRTAAAVRRAEKTT